MEPEFFLETEEFAATLRSIGAQATSDLSEDETQLVFLNEGFFRQLGYDDIGSTLRSEYSIPSGRVDYVTTGHGQSIRDTKTVVYEFKTPSKRLEPHTDQLFDYMADTGALFGVLTNGTRFRVYERAQPEPTERLAVPLASATETDASAIILCLGYWSIREQNLKPVAERVAAEVASAVPDELHLEFSDAGRERFAEYLVEYLEREFRASHDGGG